MTTNPASRYFAITPGASALSETIRGIYVGVAGDIEVTNLAGTTVVLKNAIAGSVLPIVCSHVLSTNTTATDLVGLV